ncbi:MAG: holo-ACP synthase [Gammaproteobacteria bacterium]|nr:holo-ACP synthase [Gammaproteobacteria bacterium]
MTKRTNICGIGIDLVDVRRLKKIGMRWGEPFINRLFTEQERDTARNASGFRWATLAGRFAVKEAVVKVFRGGNGKIPWTDIEVLTNPNGEPSVCLYREARTFAEQLGITRLLPSITHDANLSIAVVLGVCAAKIESRDTSLNIAEGDCLMNIRAELVNLMKSLRFDESELRDEALLKDDLEVDSTELIEISVALSKLLQKQIGDTELRPLRTFGELVGFVQECCLQDSVAQVAT